MDELRNLVQIYEAVGMKEEATRVQAEVNRLMLLGGDDYISELKASPKLPT